jgi:Pyridoxamine 5'-phosphate oxidase
VKPQQRGRAIAMTADEIDGFLAAQRTCRIATYSQAAGPHLSPVWFVWDGCTVWLHSLVRSQRFTDIARDPRVSVLADYGHDYHELHGVELRGSAVVVGEVPRVGSPDDALAEPERLFAAKYGGMTYDGRHAWLRVTPEKIVSWDFRKNTSLQA